MTSDVLYGLRSFARRPGFTSLVVVILAVGIGFVTMIASLAHSVFLGAVPYDDPERIARWWPAFCLAYDVAAAGYLAWLIMSRRTRAA